MQPPTGDNAPVVQEHQDPSVSATAQSAPYTGPRDGALRVIEWTGLVLFIVWALGLIIWGFLEPDPYAYGWRLVLELMFVGGRALNVADGVTNGFSRFYLLFQCGLQDIAVLLIVYPWIVRAYRGAQRRGFVGRRLQAMRAAADRHARLVGSFGGAGLWLFIFFPFWSTGVINGAVLGFLLGLRAWVIIGVIISSHLVSLVMLLWFFESLYGFMERTGLGALQFLPWIVLGVVIGVYVLFVVLTRRMAGGSAEN